MLRRVPALLLILAIAVACGPAQGVGPTSDPTVAVEGPVVAGVGSPAATPASSGTDGLADPTAEAAADPQDSVHVAGGSWPLTALPTGRERPAPLIAETAPSPQVSQPKPERRAKPFVADLARAADFAPQYTSYWCVGASIQMARSIITGQRDTSRRAQRRFWQMARDRSLDSPYGGANPLGWTEALNDLDLGPYRLVSLPTLDSALTTAARAMERTGRPVGLVMWAGRHAWLMTGFESTRHPRRDDARVTGVRVMDPLYPGKTRWGRSPAPDQLISIDTLARQFVTRDRPDYDFGVAPGWLLVLPVG